MKRCLFCLLALACAVDGFAQVTLEQCKEWARANYPLIRRYDLVEQSRQFTVENAMKAWLPQVGLSAGASYQSDVTSLPVEIPGVDIPALLQQQSQ